MTPEPATYPGYRFPAEIMGPAVWLYHIFSLSLRDVELLLAERLSRNGQRRRRSTLVMISMPANHSSP